MITFFDVLFILIISAIIYQWFNKKRDPQTDDTLSSPVQLTTQVVTTMSEQRINLNEINDENELQELLDYVEDFEARKLIRARLKEIKDINRAQREEKMNRLVNTREEMIQKKAREAAEHKQRTLDMYDKMAKSAPAGAYKTMNVGILKNSFDEGGSESTSGSILQQDLVEKAIQDRIKGAEDRKKKILAAYDQAAKSGPAGSERIVNFENIRKEDVQKFEAQKPTGACTFGASGGIPRVVKATDSRPGTPQSPTFGKSPFEKVNEEEKLDAMQRAIRDRQREAQEAKRRTLAAYDTVARMGAGPKQVGVEELRRIQDNRLNARAKFEQMDSSARNKPNFRPGQSTVMRSATDIKDMLLRWCKAKTSEYPNVEITNFSSSWADGLAFCALIHHFYPDAFDFKALDAKNRRKNFEIAFKTAEEKADIAPLLDVEDMILMKNKPDWKCVFTYVQSMYRHLRELD